MATRKIAALLVLLTGLGALGVAAYRLGYYRFNYPSESRFPIFGVDVSHHQGSIDWQTLARHEVGFAFIKSTEGATFTDPQFAKNWQGALSAGIPWAPYHFFTFCTPGPDQAAHFRSAVASASHQLPPAIDIEFVGNCRNWSDLRTVRAELAAFLELVERDFKQRPVLYVTNRTEEELLADHFPTFPRWPRSIFMEPASRTFRRWSFWQFADNARLPGISGPVDLNVYCCSRSQFPIPAGP